MTTLQIEEPIATEASVMEDSLVVNLADGRSISVPLSWYPRLFNGSVIERQNLVIEGGGVGIHWADLDEDISIEGLIEGVPLFRTVV
jgi:hypothetical protein